MAPSEGEEDEPAALPDPPAAGREEAPTFGPAVPPTATNFAPVGPAPLAEVDPASVGGADADGGAGGGGAGAGAAPPLPAPLPPGAPPSSSSDAPRVGDPVPPSHRPYTPPDAAPLVHPLPAAAGELPGGAPRRVHLGQINISSSGGRIRINASGGRGVSVNRTNGNNNNANRNANDNANSGAGAAQEPQPQQFRQQQIPTTGTTVPNPMLPPLEPMPVPNQTSDGVEAAAAAAAEASAKDMKRFECSICFEYMEYPVGCGSCDTRFCQQCLSRVLREGLNNRPPQSTDPPDVAKCPNCRSFFNFRTMVMDRALAKEISDCTDTVTCPFAGCGKEMAIGLLKNHEATCTYIRMRCRYADWGCDWVGRKSDLANHETTECAFRGGLGTLVERFRQGDAKVGHILHQHHHQIAATSQMLSLHSRQLMIMRARNAGSVLDVLELAYEVSLYPGRFSAMRDVWSGMINQLEARCMVCNAMLLTPSLVLVFNVSYRGFRLLSSVQFSTLSSDDMLFLVDDLVLSVIVTIVGALCISCFFIDAKGSTGWTIYNIPNLVPGRTLLRDLAAACTAMVHFSAIEFVGLHPGIMLWHFVALLTVGYTAFVSRIIDKNAAAGPDDAETVESARAWPVVVFGLRYGLLTAACGLAPTLNAAAMLRLYKDTTGAPPAVTVEDTECFLTQIGGAALWTASSLIMALAYGTSGDDGVSSWLNAAHDLMLALAGLAYVNGLVFLLDKAGRRLGETNFHAGNQAFMQAHRASGATVPNLIPTPLGCAVLGVCSFLLLCIATG